jgi:hypothetical protein
MGVSGQRHAPAALYPQGMNPWFPLDRRLGGPQSRSGLRMRCNKIINQSINHTRVWKEISECQPLISIVSYGVRLSELSPILDSKIKGHFIPSLEKTVL